MLEYLLNNTYLFLLFGYLATVLIETPILFFGLSSHYSPSRKILISLWLTACTYPIVILVLPILIYEPYGRTAYLVVAETFAPIAECFLFLFINTQNEKAKRSRFRDMLTILLANITSFLLAEGIVHLFYSS